MGKNFEKLTNSLKDFIRKQDIFFIGTASSDSSEVYIAAKGNAGLKIIDVNHIIFPDNCGCHINTARHLSENDKISLLWCSFGEKPCNLWTYGKGEVISDGTDEFNNLLK